MIGSSFTETREPELAQQDPLRGKLAPRGAQVHLNAFVADLRDGRPWLDALLDCIALWDVPTETVGDRDYTYLIEGEAFDWLLLAERILDAAPPGLIPPDEAEALLVDEEPPRPLEETEFERRLGVRKYHAHLNYVYGVRVEGALQLAMEMTVQKERGTVTWAHGHRESANDCFGRIYGATQTQLLRDFRAQTERPMLNRMDMGEWKAFTYWLFKRRLQVQDPARVASDTRRGLLHLQHLEAIKQRRRPGAASFVPDDPQVIIDSFAVPVR